MDFWGSNDSQLRKELYMMVRYYDDLFTDGQFWEADLSLMLSDVSILDVSVLLGIATFTLCAKEKLNARRDFMRRLRARLEAERPNTVEELLRGLE